ncbi:MAG: ATPase [Thalassobius sp.]|nr:ATPase [Thalassovita sp.]
MIKRIVITGGPGAGKTTLINMLEELGFLVSHEVSRKLIKQEAKKKDGVLPWKNLPLFAEKACLAMKKEWSYPVEATPYGNITPLKPLFVFYDRGLPDIEAYLLNAKEIVSNSIDKVISACRYQKKVFWCAPWEDIYVQDPERPQDFQLAKDLGITIKQVYEYYDYQVIEVPKDTPSQRVDFILGNLE